jgi:transcriptional regulator NrdR family protein
MTAFMSCPICAGAAIGVVDSRQASGHRLRRRRCLTCGHRWSTYEVSGDVFLRMRAVLQQASAVLAQLQAMKRSLEIAMTYPGEAEEPPAETDERNAA